MAFSLNFQKVFSDFELQGVQEDVMTAKSYQTIMARLETEEATCALTSDEVE